MEHDFTTARLSLEGHAEKEHTRRLPLEAVRNSSAWLWDPVEGRLRYDWMELAGKEAPTFRVLLEGGALVPGGPAKFVGVDYSPSVVHGCRQFYGPDAPAEWHAAALDSLVSEKGAFAHTGVLVYDTEDGVHKLDWTTLECVGAFARRQADTLGEFVLVVNVAGHPRFASVENVVRYLKRLSAATGQEVTPDALHVYRSNRVPMFWTMVTFGF